MRATIAEGKIVTGTFTTGDTVTVTVYDLSDSSVVATTAGTCAEIATTGIFKWNTTDITTQPTSHVEYLWVMSDGAAASDSGTIVLGGYPDRTLDAVEIKQSSVADVSATTTQFVSALTETQNDFWNRMAVIFTSGNNAGQMRRIKNYVGATKAITLHTPLDAAPANNDTFILPVVRAFLTPDIEDVADAVLDELVADHVVAGSLSKTTSDILTDTGTTIPGRLDTIDTANAAILTDTGTTVPAQIAALNNISTAQVNTEADTALTDYGANTTTPPTVGEVADAVWDEAMSGHLSAGTYGLIISDMIKLLGYKLVRSGNTVTIYESNGTDIWRTYNVASQGRVVVP